jgi:hypothetical protein
MGADQATKNCRSCSTPNPPNNKFCGNCGGILANQSATIDAIGPVGKEFPSGFIFLLACLPLLGALVYFLIRTPQKPHTTETNPPLVTASPASAVAQPPPPPGSQWDYSTDKDRMGRARSFASVKSSNMLEFDFPYAEPQRGFLTIRKVRATDVMIGIQRGQFLCGIETCTVNVRFDEGEIRHFAAAEPTDHSTTVLFIEDPSLFLSQLRKAKTVSIEATFFQQGSQALQFDVEGFKPL